MKVKRHYRFIFATMLAGWLTSAGSARAQYQVNQPGDPGPNAPVSGQQNTANRPGQPQGPGRELYGNNNADKGTRYPTQILPLPSEVRMAQEKSGALPSEIRAQAEAAGPLSPHGGFDYIPVMSPLQAAMGMTPPVLFGPAWEPSTRFDARLTAPRPVTPIGAARQGNDSPVSPLNVTPKPLEMGRPINHQVTGPLGPITHEDTTTFRVLPKGPPSTQPLSVPSLAPSTQPAFR